MGAADPHDHALAGRRGVLYYFDLEIGHVLRVVEVLAQIGDDLLIAVFDLELE